MDTPRILIAGTSSGTGKTTICLGIMAALTKLGKNVQPFKVGPDYIDPSYHTKATNNNSINLDTTLTSSEIVNESFKRYATADKIAIIEGVMGLFDGSEGKTDKNSTAEVAKLLDCPVVLVIDAKSMARSALAIALGFINFDPKVNVVGIIVNNVGSERHKSLLKEAFSQLAIPVLGYIMRNKELKLTERHLGLIPVLESDNEVKEELRGNFISSQVDLDLLLNLANGAPPIKSHPYENIKNNSKAIKIAVARDNAFNFYYWDGLKYLEELGAEITYFSPLQDNCLPTDISGVIIGGGFPELFLEQLSNNKSMLNELHRVYREGMPIYAECGGYMYLCRGIYSFDNDYFPMVNIVPCDATMEKSLAGMGYRTGEIQLESVLGDKGRSIKGHEFHYSKIINIAADFPWALKLFNTRVNKWVEEGFADKNLLASYLHIHWRGLPELAQGFINKCQGYQLRKGMKNCELSHCNTVSN
ncbi:MAG: cobyrinate a,c-diamide synthase [Bacillota bacterium]|nr:cobyrinate a,c-diamide synthase [Bacillota bacterium]